MKNSWMRAMIAILMTIMMCMPAYADGASISLGGKLGLMYVHDSVTLKPKLKKLDADDLTWSSSDEDVATVRDGKISAQSAGRTIITVSAGGTAARCGVVVLPTSVEMEAGESYALPNGTLEKYAVKDTDIATINDDGVISAKKAGNTTVGVRYGKQTMFIKLKVTGASTVKQSAAADLDCAGDTDQIVLVDYRGDSEARLSIHEKHDGLWTELYSCTAYVGEKGIGKTREGDKKTPSGTYNLTQPFGIKSDPGANMDYTQVTKYHYWCGTSDSRYYNQMVDMRETNRKYTSSDEYLIEYGRAYNYCMFIDYNAAGEAGKGSCIFLHCQSGDDSTSGCISVPEKVMKTIVKWAEPGAKIVIR